MSGYCVAKVAAHMGPMSKAASQINTKGRLIDHLRRFPGTEFQCLCFGRPHAYLGTSAVTDGHLDGIELRFGPNGDKILMVGANTKGELRFS